MSTSELRRGPGWWMDLDGQWNSPESWPESSPPLPGWSRVSDGSWAPPAFAAPSHESVDIPVLEKQRSRPIPESATRKLPTLDSISAPVEPAPKSSLQFAATQANVQPDVDERRVRNRAMSSLIIAAVTAIMISAGLVVLLAML